MTAQIADRLLLEGDAEPFDLAAIAGGPLFDPRTHDLEPAVISTACWRGWHATYAVREGALLVTELGIGLTKEALAALPRLQGLAPHKRYDDGRALRGGVWVEEKIESFEWFFEPLTLPVPFTGGLLVGRDFIRELYVHMGHHPAWKYKQVVELTFVDGRLESMQRRSEAMAELRERLKHCDSPRRGAMKEEVAAWIESTFSRRYPGLGE